MEKTFNYFENEKGDFTLTFADQPVGFVKDVEFAVAIDRMQSELSELRRWKAEQQTVWKDVYDYMHHHPEMKLGESFADKALSMIRERDAIVNILKIRG